MGTFKTNLYDICSEVAAEFSGWSFVSGQFKNKSMRHTDLIIYLGLGFDGESTSLYPGITLNNKKSIKLCKSLIDYELATSMVSFQAIADSFQYIPENLRLGCRIVSDKSLLKTIEISNAVKDRFIHISEAHSILTSILKDGIAFIENNYDLSSEESLLRNLPARYKTRNKIPYDEMERQKGVVMCIVHILLGDFDFVDRYRSDEFLTVFPKRLAELDKIAAALPVLKRRYVETGSVI